MVILVDFFETLVWGISTQGMMSSYVGRVGLTEEQYALKDRPGNMGLLYELLRGHTTERSYWETVIEDASWPIEVDMIVNLTREIVKIPVPGTFDVVRRLHRQDYRLVLVSDIWKEFKDAITTIYPDELSLFERKFFSDEYQTIKSDPGYFEFIAKQIGVEPQDMLLIDDYTGNVNRAKQVGMDAILFRSADQLERDLIARGIPAAQERHLRSIKRPAK